MPPLHHGLSGPPVGMIGYEATPEYGRPPTSGLYPPSSLGSYPSQHPGPYPPPLGSPYVPPSGQFPLSGQYPPPITPGLDGPPWNDYRRRMGWLGTIPSYSDTIPPYGNSFGGSQSMPPMKSVQAVAELRGQSPATGTIIFRQTVRSE